MNKNLTPEQKRSDASRAKYWAIYDAKTKKAASQFNDYSAQQAYLRRREWNKRIKIFEDAELCYRFVTDRMYEKTRCINYYVWFDYYAYIRLSWAIKVGVPHTAYYEDDVTEMVTLTPYGLQWVLRYLLRKHGKLVIRPISLEDRFILTQKH